MPRKTKSPRTAHALAEARTETLMQELDEKVRPLQATLQRAVENHLAHIQNRYRDATDQSPPAVDPAEFGRLMVEGLIRHEFLMKAVREHGKELDGINDLLAQAGIRPRRKGARYGRKAGQ